MTPEEMCENCIHNSYCMCAFLKTHWCGNYIGKGGIFYDLSYMQTGIGKTVGFIEKRQQDDDL